MPLFLPYYNVNWKKENIIFYIYNPSFSSTFIAGYLNMITYKWITHLFICNNKCYHHLEKTRKLDCQITMYHFFPWIFFAWWLSGIKIRKNIDNSIGNISSYKLPIKEKRWNHEWLLISLMWKNIFRCYNVIRNYMFSKNDKKIINWYAIITFLFKLVDHIEANIPLKEKQNSAYKFALCGNMMLAISIFFIGPVPFINITPSFRLSQV